MIRKVTILASLALATGSYASTVFDNLYHITTPYNVPSIGYEATQTSEFGGIVTLAGTDRKAESASFTMSDWAAKSQWATVGDATGFDHAVTLNIYGVNSNPASLLPGALLSSVTKTFHMLWRPEYDNIDGSWGAGHNHGLAFDIKFDLSTTGLTLPNTFIYGLAYNTADYGANPTHVSGPYNSLNFGIADGVTEPLTIGSYTAPDAVYFNSATSGQYADAGVGGVGIFRKDATTWTGFQPLSKFNAVPEPCSMIALAGAGLAVLKRRRKN